MTYRNALVIFDRLILYSVTSVIRCFSVFCAYCVEVLFDRYSTNRSLLTYVVFSELTPEC